MKIELEDSRTELHATYDGFIQFRDVKQEFEPLANKD